MHESGHANYIIIDIKRMKCTRIEPRGLHETFYDQDYLDCVLTKLLLNPVNALLSSTNQYLNYTNDDIDPSGKPCKNRTRFKN